ncbi:plasminogen-like [Gigantopelta aegis]|uniref:plasminogen-like n=1 Tax=Gigantopelta aegis TaxID=1735272 RepID=UPI001B88A89F|nr:plasminogen-like [Gigantopelta aegis]
MLCYWDGASYRHSMNGAQTRALQCYRKPTGRYVKLSVVLKNPDSLQLCEVRVINLRQSNAPLECLKVKKSRSYKGGINFTVHGERCVRWDDVPDLTYTSIHFPDYTVQEAGNKCRNPNGEKKRVWCYTSPDKRWSFCPLVTCSE